MHFTYLTIYLHIVMAVNSLRNVNVTSAYDVRKHASLYNIFLLLPIGETTVGAHDVTKITIAVVFARDRLGMTSLDRTRGIIILIRIRVQHVRRFARRAKYFTEAVDGVFIGLVSLVIII